MNENMTVVGTHGKPGTQTGLATISGGIQNEIIQYVATIGPVKVTSEQDVQRFKDIEQTAKKKIAAVDALLEAERVKRYNSLQEVYDLKAMIRKPLDLLASAIVSEVKRFRKAEVDRLAAEEAERRRKAAEIMADLEKQNQAKAAQVMGTMAAGGTGDEDEILNVAAKLEAEGNKEAAEKILETAIDVREPAAALPQTRLDKRKYGLKKYARIVDRKAFLTAAAEGKIPDECVAINLTALHDRVRKGTIDPGVEIFEA